MVVYILGMLRYGWIMETSLGSHHQWHAQQTQQIPCLKMYEAPKWIKDGKIRHIVLHVASLFHTVTHTHIHARIIAHIYNSI